MKAIAICNLPDGIKLDHAWFVAEDGLYAQKVAIRPLPEMMEEAVPYQVNEEEIDAYQDPYATGFNDAIRLITGETE